MESAGYRPRPRSVLLLLAAPEPCALALMMAASSCTHQNLSIRTTPVMSDVAARRLEVFSSACICHIISMV